MSPENLNDLVKLYQATVMLSSDEPHQPVDVLLFHNRSYGDYTGLFEIARKMFEEGRVRFIAVTNNEGERFGSTIPFEANPGMTECIRLLTQEQKIPANRILYPESRAFNAREENSTFLELSRQNEWRTGVILTQPHQLLRAMLGMVQTMEQQEYQMGVYTTAPSSTPWQEVVRGNQGTDLKPRVEHIADELERIHRYQTSGELATFDQLLDYLEAREKGNLILGPVQRGSERLMRDFPPNLQIT